MFELYALMKFTLAMFLGGILGWQRERAGKSAGPRTYGLVAAGSCLFTIMSLYAFGNEFGRIAANIVTGIGFLGAGMILHKDSKVEGLTTAAGMWIVAAIGMAVGVGYYFLAIFSTIIIFIALFYNDDHLQKWYKRD
jgi:putative Mg2+ transporter-C (MgtC) family protein